MPEFLWIVIGRTAGVMRDSPDVPQAIRIPSMYEAEILDHY